MLPSVLHDALQSKLGALGQASLMPLLTRLDEEAAHRCLSSLDTIDTHKLSEFQALITQVKTQRHDISVAPVVDIGEAAVHAAHDAEIGRALLAAHKVAVIIVAGGQGSRLGFDKPKGLYPIYPVSGRNLFDGMAAQLLRIGKEQQSAHGHAPTHPPLYIMTSNATHQQTIEAFEAARHFGLDPSLVYFFCQAECPALTERGELMLTADGSVVHSPDGHGGCIEALQHSGALADMRSRGITWVYYGQVDNPALRLCDPAFLGMCAQRKADVGVKVVRRRGPQERVGVFALRDHKPAIVEYSELPQGMGDARDARGELLYWAGNTAIHLFSLDLLGYVAEHCAREPEVLPWHLAHKAVEFLDHHGQLIRPTKPNAWKFERFIFDVMPLAQQVIALEVDRGRDFAPVKSREGDDTPEAARAQLETHWRATLKACGVELAPELQLEVDPAWWGAEEAFAAWVDIHRDLIKRQIAAAHTSVMIGPGDT